MGIHPVSEPIITSDMSEIDKTIARSIHRGDKRLRQFLADVPDPREYAYRLPARLAELLMGATRKHSCLMVSEDAAKVLRPFDLVGYGTRFLTAFGSAVYRELTSGDDA